MPRAIRPIYRRGLPRAETVQVVGRRRAALGTALRVRANAPRKLGR